MITISFLHGQYFKVLVQQRPADTKPIARQIVSETGNQFVIAGIAHECIDMDATVIDFEITNYSGNAKVKLPGQISSISSRNKISMLEIEIISQIIVQHGQPARRFYAQTIEQIKIDTGSCCKLIFRDVTPGAQALSSLQPEMEPLIVIIKLQPEQLIINLPRLPTACGKW
jgi:hypothetical protein